MKKSGIYPPSNFTPYHFAPYVGGYMQSRAILILLFELQITLIDASIPNLSPISDNSVVMIANPSPFFETISKFIALSSKDNLEKNG